MKRIFPYYEMETTLRYGTKPWPELPHVYLANMDIPADIPAFTKIYGHLFYGGGYSSDGDAALVREAQDVLRKAWAKDADALRRLAEGKPESPPGREISFGGAIRPLLFNRERFHLSITHFSITEIGLEIEADDLWSFTQLAFLRDYNLGRLRFAPIQSARHPIFSRAREVKSIVRIAVLWP